jgi:hypothetical protein
VSVPVNSAPAVTAVPVVTASPLMGSLKRTAEEFLSPRKDESKENSENVSKSSVKPKTEKRKVRPFIRTHRPQVVKPVDTISSLLQELVAGQERHASKATHYDRAVKIFQERFRFGLNSRQEMGMITLFAECSSAVKQFLAFTEEQRDIFVYQKVALM